MAALQIRAIFERLLQRWGEPLFLALLLRLPVPWRSQELGVFRWQRMSGQYEISAPKHMHAGILDRIYAIWNCTAP